MVTGRSRPPGFRACRMFSVLLKIFHGWMVLGHPFPPHRRAVSAYHLSNKTISFSTTYARRTHYLYWVPGPCPAPSAYCMLRLGGFPHRIPDTFAGDSTSSLPPAEPLCLLLELPTQAGSLTIGASSGILLSSSLSPGPTTWYPLIFWWFQVAQAQFLAQNKHSKNVEWMAVNKPLGLQMGCYVDVILGCLFSKTLSLLLLLH